jgi:hypothetical protein
MPETKGLSLLQIREMYLGKHTKTISIPVFKDVETKDAKARTTADDADEKQNMLTSSV